MKYKAKSIKTVLTHRKAEIYQFCDNKGQFKDLKIKVLEILSSDELAENESVLEAIRIFNACANNYNKYLTTLVTYMTGMKVSLY